MKFIKWLLVTVIILSLLFFTIGAPYLRKQTKKVSPEHTALYQQEGVDIKVVYNSPSKKNRVIFGELVPYNKVWRTGANEPTKFITKTNITIQGKTLNAGTYSLWTIPNADSWTIIFNNEVPDWGVTLLSMGTETTRNPDKDAIKVVVPTTPLLATQENFKISFLKTETLSLTLSWDKTMVVVPINQ